MCNALTARQEERRAECCKIPKGIVLTSECVRMASAALSAKAVTVERDALAACLSAVETTCAGCEWVGPFPPSPPEACMKVFVGTLPKGARCRSSLECEQGARCQGVGPTTPGRCEPGKADGESCGGTTDPLAVMARQDNLDSVHPECQKKCIARRCGDPLVDGAACATSSECSPGSVCVDKDKAATAAPGLAAPKKPSNKTCVKRAPTKLGEACPSGTCEGTAECLLGICVAKKSAGAACTNDFECRGGCLKAPGQTKGVCGMRCDIR